MKYSSILVLLAIFAGCSTRNRAVGTYADGSIAHEVECWRDKPEKCLLRSRELCNPYGREPQTVQPMRYDQGKLRWITVITCGPLTPGPQTLPPSNVTTAGPPVLPPNGLQPNGAPPPPTGNMTPLPPEPGMSPRGR